MKDLKLKMVQTVTLNNGIEMPILALGTWNSAPGVVTQAVKDAIDAGYRHIDGAFMYENECEVGAAVNAKITEGVIKREDIFVVSKLWNNSHRPDLVRPALEKTLKNLNLSYLDLYLIHWPAAFKEGDEPFPAGENGKIAYSDVDYVDTWKAMEALLDTGLVKSIGISNFNSKQVDRLMESAKVTPVVNQVECHPYLSQTRLIAHHKKYNIRLSAYAPLGSPARPSAKPGGLVLMDDSVLKGLAEKYGKNVGQILIRYQVQRGVVVLPKSVNKTRIVSNADVFDFEISEEDFARLEGLNKDHRFIRFSIAPDHPHYPFNEEF